MAASGRETFLPALAKSFDKINDEQSVSTADFAAACERILPIFDHLGRHQWRQIVHRQSFVYVWACLSSKTLLFDSAAAVGAAALPVFTFTAKYTISMKLSSLPLQNF